MKLSDLVAVLEGIAPPATAESWDNVGLLVGDRQQDVIAGMLCIDYTAEVAAEAAVKSCGLVVAYHPPIFSPLKRVLAGGVVFDAIKRGVAIYSPHTALDVADGGTNDVLAAALGLVDTRPLKVSEPAATHCKLVTFVPPEYLETVSDALFAAGAGRIGKYWSCSFRTEGTGTFFGEAGSNPTVGEAGRLESVDEVKLETVLPLSKVAAVVGALQQAHPYETPAFDLVQLAAPPTGGGMGRVGRFEQPISRATVIARVKRQLGLQHLLIAGPTEGNATTAAACAGSCGGDLLDRAIAAKVDVYLTGEMRHHDALKAAAAGVTVICTLHSNSERRTMSVLRDRLAKECGGVAWHVSAKDRDPFSIA